MKLRTIHNRRQFIKLTLATTATLGLVTACRRFDLPNRIQIDPDAIKKFGASLKGYKNRSF